MRTSSAPSVVLLLVSLSLVSPPAPRAEEWQPVPIRSRAEAAAGLVGGEGHQHARGIARPASDPNRVYLAIDTAGTWRSEDGGRSWLKNLDEGLHSGQLETIAADPDRPDRIMVIAAAPGGWETWLGQFEGLYLSNDAGHTWRRRLAFEVPYAHQRYQRIYRQTIVAGPANARGQRSFFAAADGGDVYRSTDRGETWATWWAKPSDAARKAYYTLVALRDAEGHDVVLVGSTDGLHIHSDASGDGTASGDESRSLPVPDPYPAAESSGGVTGVLVHPSRPNDIVAVRRGGLSYRTTTGGRTADAWQEIRAENENGSPEAMMNPRGIGGIAINGFQDPHHAENRWLLTMSQVYRARYDGDRMTWRRHPANGYVTEPYLLEPITRGLANDHSMMAFNPADPEDIVGYKYLPWRLRGGRWVYSNDRYTGFAWTQQASGARWVPPGHYAAWGGKPGVIFFCNDVGPVISRNDLDWFTMTGGETMDVSGKSRPGTLWSTSTTGDIDPQDPQHLLALWGRVGIGHFSVCRSIDGGVTWATHPPPDPKGGFNAVGFRDASFARFLGPHPATMKLVAAAANIITLDARAPTPAWERIRFEQPYPGARPLTKLSDGRGYLIATTHRPLDSAPALPVLYGYNAAGAQQIVRGDPLPGAGKQPYGWGLVYDDWRHGLKGAADGKPVIAADPHRADRVYFAGYFDSRRNDGAAGLSLAERLGDNEVWVARLTTGDGAAIADWQSPAVERIQLAGPGFANRIPMPGNFNAVRAIAPDPNHEGVIYLGLLADGAPNVFRVAFARPGRAAEVTDISGNLSREQIGALSVRPDTGDLYIGSHFGTWRLPNPATGRPGQPEDARQGREIHTDSIKPNREP